MSKSKVNPKHKVAGRARKGEDIAQRRNKQKHAATLVRRRNKVAEGAHAPAPERGAAAGAPARTPRPPARKTRATALQPPRQKRGHNIVPGSRSSPDVAPRRTAKTAARKARATRLHTPPGQKRGHNLVPGLAAPHARFPKAARGAALHKKVQRHR